MGKRDEISFNQQELAIVRMLSVNGMMEEQKLASLLEERPLFQEGRLKGVLVSLKATGMVESSSGLCWLSEDGKTTLRRTLQEAFKDVSAIIEQEVWPVFRKLDVELKKTCTMWQVKPDGSQNPHDVPEYDFHVLETLQDIHKELLRLMGSKDVVQHKCASLLADMNIAMGRVGNGEFDFVVGLSVNSYHNLWRELHEQLLNALGLERTE